MDRQRGFTLIELMIVVTIVAILMAIVYPSYQEHVAKAKRAEAMGALMEGAQALERYYSAHSTYLDDDDKLASVFPAQVPDNGTAYYTIAAQGTPTANTYVLQATAAAGMAADKCGDFQINQAGDRTVANYASTFADADAAKAYCWRR
jgi:type IV pilus assembly protein PilE